MEKETEIGKKKRQKIIAAFLILITLTAIGITIWAVWFRETTPALAPDYAPQEIEQNAEKLDDGNEKMEVQEGGGAVSMSYQKSVSVSLSENSAALLFQNPSKSVNDIVLQLLVVSKDGEEAVIAQSGKLPPGYKLEKLALLDGAAKLSEGIYNGRFNVLYYSPETGERAIVNGNITGVTIAVGK